MQKIMKKFEVKDVEMGIYVCRENCTRSGGKFKLIRGVIKIIRDFPDPFLVYEGCPCQKSSKNSIPKTRLPPFPFFKIGRFGGKFKLNRGVIGILRDFPYPFLVL